MTTRQGDLNDITIDITKNTKSNNISTGLTALDFDVSMIQTKQTAETSEDAQKKVFKLDQEIIVVENIHKTSKFGKPSLASVEEYKALAEDSKEKIIRPETGNIEIESD